jgi:hypothetical protein
MKHLQNINEYKRTIGFRYSEPTLIYGIRLKSDTSIHTFDEQDVKTYLKEILVDVKLVEIQNEYIGVKISIYNRKELSGIIDDLVLFLSEEFGCNIIDVKIIKTN